MASLYVVHSHQVAQLTSCAAGDKACWTKKGPPNWQPEPGCRPPLIVAHRGASHLAPENTLAAFELAWELDADLIEGDFYLTSDGAIVCHHDRTTKKTAGLDVPVEDQTLEALKRLDVGAWRGEQWTGERIPTLAEVLETVPNDKAILIEIKSGVRIVPALVDVITSSDLRPAQMIVICFDEVVIAAVKDRLPHIKAYWLSGFDEDGAGGWTPTISDIIRTATGIDADGVDLEANLDVIDAALVAALRAEGLEFHAWTINEVDVARRLIDLGVDSITTDRPGWLRGELRPRRSRSRR